MSLKPHAVRSPEGTGISVAEAAWRWLAQPFQLLDECSARHGDTFTLDFGRFGTHLFLSHPDDVKSVFRGDPAVLFAGRGNRLLEPILGRQSLLLADGARHLRTRAMLKPTFRVERVQAYAPLVADAALHAAGAWQENQIVSLQRAALDVSKEVILRIVLGLPRDRIEVLSSLVDKLMLVVGTNASFDAGADKPRVIERFRAARTALDDALQEHIDDRRRTRSSSQDMLSQLVSAQAAPSDETIRDQLVTMILAGHETTASSITWALFCLSEAPLAHERLCQEIDASVDVTDPQSGELSYLAAVCCETLRLRPVVPVVSRELQAPFRLREGELPAGLYVTPCAYLAHRRPSVFPEPERFEPERFLTRRFSPYEYFPFGGGVHRCLGMGFALLEMQVVLATWLRRFSFEPIDAVRPVRRAVTIVASGGGKMRVRRRHASRH